MYVVTMGLSFFSLRYFFYQIKQKIVSRETGPRQETDSFSSSNTLNRDVVSRRPRLLLLKHLLLRDLLNVRFFFALNVLLPVLLLVVVVGDADTAADAVDLVVLGRLFLVHLPLAKVLVRLQGLEEHVQHWAEAALAAIAATVAVAPATPALRVPAVLQPLLLLGGVVVVVVVVAAAVVVVFLE